MAQDFSEKNFISQPNRSTLSEGGDVEKKTEKISRPSEKADDLAMLQEQLEKLRASYIRDSCHKEACFESLKKILGACLKTTPDQLAELQKKKVSYEEALKSLTAAKLKELKRLQEGASLSEEAAEKEQRALLVELELKEKLNLINARMEAADEKWKGKGKEANDEGKNWRKNIQKARKGFVQWYRRLSPEYRLALWGVLFLTGSDVALWNMHQRGFSMEIPQIFSSTKKEDVRTGRGWTDKIKDVFHSDEEITMEIVPEEKDLEMAEGILRDYRQNFENLKLLATDKDNPFFPAKLDKVLAPFLVDLYRGAKDLKNSKSMQKFLVENQDARFGSIYRGFLKKFGRSIIPEKEETVSDWTRRVVALIFKEEIKLTS